MHWQELQCFAVNEIAIYEKYHNMSVLVLFVILTDTGEEGKKEKSDTGFANTPSRVSTAPLLPQQYSPTNLEYQEAEL